MFLKIFKKLSFLFKKPPCWIWFREGNILERIIKKNKFLIFLEIIQQINWSITNLVYLSSHKKKIVI